MAKRVSHIGKKAHRTKKVSSKRHTSKKHTMVKA